MPPDTYFARSRVPNFAPVCGIQMYEQMAIQGVLPPYLLLLTHDIIAREDDYELLFKLKTDEWKHKGIRYTIILDNSVVELKTPIIDPHMVAHAAQVVEANVIVLPDIYKDGPATTKSTISAYHPWKTVMDLELGEDNYRFMVVPQGKTKEDFLHCAETLALTDMPHVAWWGVPRNLVELHGSREFGLETCMMLKPNWCIHMLGFSDNFHDDLWLAWRHGHRVMGIDSAVPMRIDHQFSIGDITIPPRQDGWLEEGVFGTQQLENMNYVQKILGSY